MQLDSRRSIRCTAVFTAVASCAGLVFAQPTAASPIEEPSGALATAAAHVHDSDDGCHTNCGKARMLRERFEAGLPVYDPASGEIGDREALGDTDVLHYQLEFEVFPTSQTLTGSNRITVRAVTEGVSQFTIRLRSNFTITSVTLNDVTNVPPANVASVGSYGRQIPLDRAYHANEQFTVTVGYTGVAVSRGFGSIYFGNTNAGNPIVASLSEPYYAATWWPSKDGDFAEAGDNSDKATMEMSITVPDPLRAVSNGLLQGIDALSGGRSRYRWRTDFPTASYLYCFAASVYNTRTISYNYAGGSMPIEFNVYPASDTAGNRATLDLLPSMLAAYQPMYGLYPWVNEKYGVYQFPFNGGMEHQTNTGQGVFDEYVTAHELGHQWWGDNVTCRTWNDIWLNEGFATYTEALWAERKPGSSGLTALVNAMAARKPSSAAITGTVYCDDVTNLNRIFDGNLSYDKGAWVLHMLRKVLGDTTFFNCLAVYRATYERSAATTDDFIAVCESVAGRDLHWFFNKWVYSAGWPSYEYAFQSATINNKFYVRLYLHQSQNTTYGTFTMPIDLRMNRSGGSSTVTLWNDAITEHYVIPVTAPVLNVVLDEFNWILNGTKTSVTYVPGPPKVVELSPTPGAVFNPTAGPTSIRVTFSENVTTAAANFTLTRDGTPVTPSSQSYDLPNFTQVLNFSSPLPSGNYTLVVSDAVRSVAGNVQLDGETADPANVASLPTGNGQALGSATFTFRVRPPCPLDITGDFMIDLSDLAVLLSNFGVASGATGAQGDLNGDGAVDLTDLSQLLGAFGTACL